MISMPKDKLALAILKSLITSTLAEADMAYAGWCFKFPASVEVNKFRPILLFKLMDLSSDGLF